MPDMIGENQFYRPDDFDGINETSEKIKGLNCPDCNAQAFKTDKPGVAVCGDCPGWYFLYKHDEENGKKKYKIKMVGGEYEEVPVYKTQTITNHP